MAIRYLFFVFVTLCSSSVTSLCMATLIVVDYSVAPNITFTPSATSKQAGSDKLLSAQETNKLIIKQENDTAPPMSTSKNVKELQFDGDFQTIDDHPLNKDPQQEKERLKNIGFDFDGIQQTNSLAEGSLPQQASQKNQIYASFYVRDMLRDFIKDSKILMVLAKDSIEEYWSVSGAFAGGELQAQAASPTVSYEASWDSSISTADVSVQDEETLVDKLIQFFYSWKGLLTLSAFFAFSFISLKT
jgi:hypothetical protein